MAANIVLFAHYDFKFIKKYAFSTTLLSFASQDAGHSDLTATVVYGDDGRVAQRTAPDGKVTSYTYDLNGNGLTQSVTAGGVTLTTKTEYDALNRRVAS